MKLEELMVLFLAISISPTHSQIDGDVRLSGFGANTRRGKLEIFYNDTWGTVCSPDSILGTRVFERHAAAVVCRQLGLGFPISFYTVKHLDELRSTYGNYTGSIHLEHKVECEGTEPHLLRCAGNEEGALGMATCSHELDVTVECSDVHVPYVGEVRLSNGSSGRLELYSSRQWGAVCMDDWFQQAQANAVCRQLGYTGAASFRQSSVDYSGLYWDLERNSQTDSSRQCFTDYLNGLPTMSTSCSPVHIQCEYVPQNAALNPSGNADICTLNLSTPLEGTVRLTGSTAMPPVVNGYVEVFQDGGWGTVCGDDFRYIEADVVCKQLGHPGSVLRRREALSSDSGPVHGVKCSGLETYVTDCSMQELNSTQCVNGVHVDCANYGLSPYGELMLRGRVGATGILLLSDGVKYERICNSQFGMNEANVACRQLGYKGAVAVRTNSSLEASTIAYPDVSTRLYELRNMCLGNESNLLECEQPPEPTDSCSAGGVELQCAPLSPPPLRLVRGPASSSGEVISGLLEVQFGDEWMSLGASGFSQLSAHVACTQLGFATAKQVLNSSGFGGGPGQVILDDVMCNGREDSLFDCPYTVALDQPESHDQAVAIECIEESPYPEGDLRLTNGTNSSSGRLEIFRHGVWMSTCGESFSHDVATVACVQLGFAEASHFCTNSCFGEGAGYIHSCERRCTGREGSLLECGGVVLSETLCNHSNTVGLFCVPHVSTPALSPTTTAPTPTTMAVDTTVTTPAVTIEPTLVSGFMDLYLYIIVGVASLLIVVCVVVMLVCCCCCVARKRQKTRQNTWRSPVNRTNGHTGNGHYPHHHGNMNGTKLTMEKVGDFDDPRSSVEMNGFTNSTPSIKTDSNPDLDYKPDMSLDLEQGHRHYENLPRRANGAVSNTLYVEESASPASPPPGYDELDFLPHNRT